MKVGFDAKRLFCNSTGLGNYSRTLVKNLSQIESIEINLYSPKKKNIDESKPFISNKKIKSTFNSSFLWRTKGIVKDLIKDQINLYHGLSNEIPFGLHKSKIKSVVTIHDLIFKIYPNTYKFLDRLIYDYKFRYACKNANKIVAISQSTKDDIIRYYNIPAHKIQVIYQSSLPVYLTPPNKGIQQRLISEFKLPDSFIICVGTFEDRKNQKGLIEAYSEVNKKLPLLLIGGGKKYKDEVLRLIKEKGENKNILLLNRRINDQELKALYELAKFSIYNSVYEGFGLPVLESQLCGTPVITTNTSSLKEAAAPGSILVTPNNKKQLIDAISKFVNSDLSVIGKTVKAYCLDKYNPIKLNKELEGLYKEVLDK